MWRARIAAILIFIAAAGLGFFVYSTEGAPASPEAPKSKFAFKYGLDLVGGTELIYRADLSGVPAGDETITMDALRDVVERRVNLFGVAEPLVQIERGSFVSEGEPENRLIVELPGVTDVEEAVRRLGQTPILEFRLVGTEEGTTTPTLIPTGLTGRQVSRAAVELGANGIPNDPTVSLKFNQEGAELFAKITREHVGEPLAILLDGQVISSPNINEEITGGNAIISGQFTVEEAQSLVRDLNFGALPAPIELVRTQTVGATLGMETFEKGVFAGVVGLAAVMLFMTLWYRLPGFFSAVSLVTYIFINLAIYKLIPVTLTASGIAGFILSIGMAVDANVLIFERINEELREGRKLPDAIKSGFARAWLAIRDGNITQLISAIVLFWVGTSVVEGFALTYGIGIMVSMLSAITLTRPFLMAVAGLSDRAARIAFSKGFSLK